MNKSNVARDRVDHPQSDMNEATPNYQAITAPRVNQLHRSQPTNSNSNIGLPSVGGTTSPHFRRRRHSIEQDIPDMKNVVESRQHSKKEMQSLNERLANHIEKTKYLQSQNKIIKDELHGLKSRWGKETEKVRQMYDVELRQLRRLFDEAERSKGEKDSRIISLENQNKDLKDQLQENVTIVESYSEKLDRLNHELSDRDGEIGLLRRRLSHLDDDKAKSRAQVTKLKEEISRLNRDLDGETITRLAGQAENQTLREEVQFLTRVHEQEKKELHAAINSKDEEKSREFWRHEMGQAIHDIMKEYDDKVDNVRSELENVYLTKIRDLAKLQQTNSPEINYLRDENNKMKEKVRNLRAQITQQQNKNEQLERMLQDAQQQFESERRRFMEEQERADKDLRDTESDLRKILTELQVLLDAKLSLELEIGAYKKLMDVDDTKSVDKISTIHPLTSLQPKSEHDRFMQTSRAEITAKTQCDKSFKGNVCIEDCALNGRYIVLTNVGKQREVLNNFRILRNIDNGASAIRHQIQNLVLNTGESVKIWAKGFKPVGSDDHEIANSSWGVGSNVQTFLFNEEGKERAMHHQRTIYGDK